MKKSIFMIAALAAMTACTSTQKENQEEAGNHSLIVVYSQTGTTMKVAEQIQSLTGADLDTIKCVTPYDGDFGQTIARCQQEMADSVMPELLPLQADLAKYDTIYLGYPIWFGTYAPPVAAFLAQADLKGKVVIPFCTFGSGGLNTSIANLAQAAPEATIAEGYGVRTLRIESADAEVEEFLVRAGIIAGEAAPLAEFSEIADVTPDQAEIFRVATSGYQFPLGNAVKEQHRERGEATEYCFETDQNTKIYVLDHHELRIAPEFTQVVR